jgi:hypothetical protein
MNRALKWGGSKYPLLIAVAVAGVLSTGIVTVKSAEPAAAPPGPDRELARMDGHMGRCAIDKKLSPEQIRDIVAGRMAQFGEGTLKVGKVTTKEPGVVSVEIDTTSGSLVATREISTKTGGPAALEKLCDEHAGPPPRDGHGPMGQGGPMGHRGMMAGDGPGGFGGMGFAGGERGRDLNLSADQVRKLADAKLILAGNPRLKVGDVKEKDANTFTVDIVTVDNALVMHREVDRHTGRVHRAI